MECVDNLGNVDALLRDIWISHKVNYPYTLTNAVVTTRVQAFNEENECPTNPSKGHCWRGECDLAVQLCVEYSNHICFTKQCNKNISNFLPQILAYFHLLFFHPFPPTVLANLTSCMLVHQNANSRSDPSTNAYTQDKSIIVVAHRGRWGPVGARAPPSKKIFV